MAKKSLANLWGVFGRSKAEMSAIDDSSAVAAIAGLISAGQIRTAVKSKGQILADLPPDRLAQYPFYDDMRVDDICGQALNIHSSNAFSVDELDGHAVKIESRTNEKDKTVNDLRATFQDWVDQTGKEIAEKVAAYGCWGIRPYPTPKKDGIDPTRIMIQGACCHPANFRVYENFGAIVGYQSNYQDQNRNIELGKPWQMIVAKMDGWSDRAASVFQPIDPSNPNAVFDLWNDEPAMWITERTDYGKSLFDKAFKPWSALGNASISLLYARMKSSFRETLIAYPLAGQNPQTSAELSRNLTDILQAKDEADAKKDLRNDGFVQTGRKIIVPYDSSGKGDVRFMTTEGNVNIEGISDLLIWLRRLCGSLGVDPSLIGHSDQMAGGLGEGGWLRTSILAAMTAQNMRAAYIRMLNRLFDIHVYYRFGKIYHSGNRPWRIHFHAVSDAKELEAGQKKLSQMDYAERLANLLLTLQEGGSPALKNHLLNNVLREPEDVVRDLIGGDKKEKFDNSGEKAQEGIIEEAINGLVGL